jgi:hypothetical protein
MLSNKKNIDDIAVDTMTFPMTSHRIISETTSASFLLSKMLFHSFELSLSLMFSAAYEATSVEDTSLAGPVQFHKQINKYINMVCCRLSVHDRKVDND